MVRSNFINKAIYFIVLRVGNVRAGITAACEAPCSRIAEAILPPAVLDRDSRAPSMWLLIPSFAAFAVPLPRLAATSLI